MDPVVQSRNGNATPEKTGSTHKLEQVHARIKHD